MRKTLFLFFISFHLGLGHDLCEAGVVAGVVVSGYNRNISIYGANDDGILTLCQSFRVDLNMSWLDPGPDFMYGIHEVGEFEGVRGGAVGRFDVTSFGYQRLEWVSVGAGKIYH